MRILKYTLAIVFVVTILGCSPRMIRYEATPRPTKPADYPMDILKSDDIGREYVVIGEVEWTVSPLWSTERILKGLRESAQKMGGDALMDLQRRSYNSGVTIVESRNLLNQEITQASSNTAEVWSAKVIVWK